MARVTLDQYPQPTSTGQVVCRLEHARYAVFCALVTLIAAWGAVLCTQVSAQAEQTKPAGDYEALLDQAVSAFESNDFMRAHELFGQAYALRPNARVSRGLGIAALRLTRYTEAWRWLSSALEDKNQPLTSSQRDEVTKLMSWMQASLGVLRLRWSTPPPHGSEVRVDDVRVQALTLWLTPGAHRVHAQAPGFETRDESVELVAGHEQTRELSLTPIARAPELVTLHREDMLGSEDATQPAAQSSALDLRPAPLTPERHDNPSVLSRWWFWTAVGVVVAGGVTAAVIMTTKGPERPYETGGEGGLLHARGVFP